MQVTVFSTTNCAVCHAEMQWLDGQGISYNNVVVDEDSKGMEKMLAATGGTMLGTPFTTVETEGVTTSVIGFDRKKLLELLTLN